MKKSHVTALAVSILVNVIGITYWAARREEPRPKMISRVDFMKKMENQRRENIHDFMKDELKLSSDQISKFDYYNDQYLSQFRASIQSGNKDAIKGIMANRDKSLTEVVGAENLEILKWKMNPRASIVPFEVWKQRKKGPAAATVVKAPVKDLAKEPVKKSRQIASVKHSKSKTKRK